MFCESACKLLTEAFFYIKVAFLLKKLSSLAPQQFTEHAPLSVLERRRQDVSVVQCTAARDGISSEQWSCIVCMYVCMYVCLFAQAITDVQCEH